MSGYAVLSSSDRCSEIIATRTDAHVPPASGSCPPLSNLLLSVWRAGVTVMHPSMMLLRVHRPFCLRCRLLGRPLPLEAWCCSGSRAVVCCLCWC